MAQLSVDVPACFPPHPAGSSPITLLCPFSGPPTGAWLSTWQAAHTLGVTLSVPPVFPPVDFTLRSEESVRIPDL